MIQVRIMHVEDRESQSFLAHLPAVPAVGHVFALHTTEGEEMKTHNYVVRGVEWDFWAVPERGRHPFTINVEQELPEEEEFQPSVMVWVDDAEMDDSQGRYLMKRPLA